MVALRISVGAAGWVFIPGRQVEVIRRVGAGMLVRRAPQVYLGSRVRPVRWLTDPDNPNTWIIRGHGLRQTISKPHT